jgi:putative transposase
MKIRLFPTDEEKRWIKVAEGDSRWYYNRALECIKGIQVMQHDQEINERKHPGEISTKNSSELQKTPLFPYYLERKALMESRDEGSQCVYRFSRGRQKGERCNGTCNTDKFFCSTHKAYEDKFMKRVKIPPLKVERVREFLSHVVMDEWIVHQWDEPNELKHCVHSEWSYSYNPEVSNTHIESPEDIKRIRGNGKKPTSEVAQRFRYGVLENLVRDLKSAMANGRKDLVYRLKSKKDKHQLVSADCWLDTRTKTMLPKVLKNIKGRFKVGKKPIDLQQLTSRIGEDNENRSYTILHDKEQARYFLMLPVSHDWFSKFKSDIKHIPCENQTLNERFSVASLDPGVFPAQCLYGLNHTVDIGTDSAKILLSLLLKEDELHSLIQQKIHLGINRRKIKRLRQRIKNLVSEQHWKTCSFLTNNYESILLPEYKISEMMKGKKISKKTKRQMQVLSPTTFKTRLINKCKQKGVFICICSEVYTSKTCGWCGVVNMNLRGEKEWVCPHCGIFLWRDPNSARLILIKNCFS